MYRLLEKCKKSMILMLCVIILCFTGCGNKEKTPKPINGKYVSADGESYIILSEYEHGRPKGADADVFGKGSLQFTNVDLSTFSKYCIHNNTSNYIYLNKLGGLSVEEREEITKMFEDKIDLENQFMNNSAEFEYFYSEVEKGYGFMCEIEGSGFDGAYECYVTVEYVADEKTIICDEIKYVLEE